MASGRLVRKMLAAPESRRVPDRLSRVLTCQAGLATRSVMLLGWLVVDGWRVGFQCATSSCWSYRAARYRSSSPRSYIEPFGIGLSSTCRRPKLGQETDVIDAATDVDRWRVPRQMWRARNGVRVPIAADAIVDRQRPKETTLS